MEVVVFVMNVLSFLFLCMHHSLYMHKVGTYRRNALTMAVMLCASKIASVLVLNPLVKYYLNF